MGGELRRRLGDDGWDALLRRQGGSCSICQSTDRTGRNLAVDHDHQANLIRGLLCTRCNQGLGYFSDDVTRLRRAIAYLEGEHGPFIPIPDKRPDGRGSQMPASSRMRIVLGHLKAGYHGFRHTDEVRARIAAKMRGRRNPKISAVFARRRAYREAVVKIIFCALLERKAA